MDISIIAPVHNEENNIRELYAELLKEMEAIKKSFEIMFIDDGSSDNSFEVMKAIAKRDKRVRLISFRKNFGQTAALAAGFDHAKGQIVITIDADMQNDPKDIKRLLNEIDKGYSVVSGWRRRRKDNFFTRIAPSYIANHIISFVSGVKLHDYGCTLKAYKKEVFKDFKLYSQMHRFLPAYAKLNGAKVKEIEVNHRPRQKGKSKYGIMKTFNVISDLLTMKFLGSFSTRPMYLFGSIGLLCLLLGFISFFITAYRTFYLGKPYATPMVFMMVLFFITAVQLFMMGFLAEILSRIYYEVRKKRTYSVQESINLGEDNNGQGR